jgi:hypothetical protein
VRDPNEVSGTVVEPVWSFNCSNNAQLWTPPRHQNIAMRCLKLTMGDPQIVKLILAVLAVGMVVGFVAGYAVRAAISHHRHALARRSRLIGGR